MSANVIAPEMIRSAIDGDQMAIEKLLAISQPNIRRYAVHYCLNHEDAEDATQETLWCLYRRSGASSGRGGVSVMADDDRPPGMQPALRQKASPAAP